MAIVKDITAILQDISNLSKGVSDMNPSVIESAVASSVKDLSALVSDGSVLGSDLKDAVNMIISDYKDAKNPIKFIEDIVALKGKLESVVNDISSVEEAAKTAEVDVADAVNGTGGIVKRVFTDGKSLLNEVITEDKEFVHTVKTAFHDAVNKTSPHHGIASFMKTVVSGIKDVVKADAEAVGKFMHDALSPAEKQKLVDFAHKILSEAETSALEEAAHIEHASVAHAANITELHI